MADAWANATGIVKNYSDNMIRRWNAEIDTLLVYADPVLAALAQISAQLSSFSSNPPFINSTAPPFQSAYGASPPPPHWVIWLNAAWFFSLLCSLAAASVGITVKQWLHEYSVGLSGTSREVARLRQHRLNSLRKWRVAEIVAALPVLLQLALVLFGAGMLTLLWNLDHHTAAIVSVGAALMSVASTITIVLPWFYDDCPFLSSQSLTAYDVFEGARYTLQRFVIAARAYLRDALGRFKCVEIAPGSQNNPTPLAPRQTWRAREHALVQQSRGHLDANILSQAHHASMEEEFADVAAICALDLATNDVYEYCELLCALHDRDTPDSSVPTLQALLRRHPNLWNALFGPVTLALIFQEHRWQTPVGQIYENAFIYYGEMFCKLGVYIRNDTDSMRSLPSLYASITTRHPEHRLSIRARIMVVQWYHQLAGQSGFDTRILEHVRCAAFAQFCYLDAFAACHGYAGTVYFDMLYLFAKDCCRTHSPQDSQDPDILDGPGRGKEDILDIAKAALSRFAHHLPLTQTPGPPTDSELAALSTAGPVTKALMELYGRGGGEGQLHRLLVVLSNPCSVPMLSRELVTALTRYECIRTHPERLALVEEMRRNLGVPGPSTQPRTAQMTTAFATETVGPGGGNSDIDPHTFAVPLGIGPSTNQGSSAQEAHVLRLTMPSHEDNQVGSSTTTNRGSRTEPEDIPSGNPDTAISK
ncbi:hypothetical protein C8Q78DRAFT_557243 [Trametes maxima]|nr:hypothetical protein C8Q78DRAFT_557243 [Trametes maxima]